AQFKTNYFEYPNAFWVSDSIYHDSLYLNDIQNEIKLYVKTKYIPPSFTTDAIVYDTDCRIPQKGYYIAFSFEDSLFVISGDEYQNHFTVEANYSDVESLISAANKYFNLPQLPPEIFTFNDWYGLTAVFEIDNKIAELRGYDRKYRLYSEEFDYEVAQSPHKYGDSIYNTDTLEISIIELVVYNE
ncbi:MAG: hypothetical protein GY855_05175, partial [candidate division Zixibacteria bacterium]|nr:hypothetical protein [candidate division Zixibacteria bacterium]